MNLLMLSGDTSIAEGKSGAFAAMLSRFSTHWDRIDIITPATPRRVRCIGGNIYIHVSSYPKVLHPFFIYQTGRMLLAERPYHLMVSHDFGFFYNGLGAYWLRHYVPWVSELHHIEGYPIAVSRREQLYRWMADLYVGRVKDHITAFRVVNRGDTYCFLRDRYVPDTKILVLYSLYLDLDIFRPLPNEPTQYDLLFVGRLATNKGIWTIMETLREVKIHFPAVKLGILGEGSLRLALEKYIHTFKLQENVIFIPPLGSPQEVARLYNQAKMLICASTAEGGPRVTVEAMACGIPVISTPVGVMPELIDHGQNGFLAYQKADFAPLIRKLLEDDELCQQLGEQGLLTVQKFQADNMIKRYADGLKECVS